ncbi:MAG: cysteine peptidase family C39 domain-containing protein [Sulfuricellaceae bacterium]|nr:cysteine peptidase family C39 domain-containing protein [Sulfuricellaceae bacterium]
MSKILWFALGLAGSSFAHSAALIATETLNGMVPVKTWKALRDERVVKQDTDYSCGAASLATLLSHYYQRPTMEKEILDLLSALNKDKGAISFEDMSRILPTMGFRGIGLALSWEQLTKSKLPVTTQVGRKNLFIPSVRNGC